jgi:UrcA family protein
LSGFDCEQISREFYNRSTKESEIGNGGVAATQTTFEYGDLNIANQRDAKTLLARVRNAAFAVCGGKPDVEIHR